MDYCIWYRTQGFQYFTSTSLFTGGTLYYNLNNFHEYLIQHSLKSGGTKDHFRQEKVRGTTLYWKAWVLEKDFYPVDLIFVMYNLSLLHPTLYCPCLYCPYFFECTIFCWGFFSWRKLVHIFFYCFL